MQAAPKTERSVRNDGPDTRSATRALPIALLLLAAPVPAYAVSDLAREIPPSARSILESILDDHRARTGHRIVVTTVPTAASIPMGDIASGALASLGPDADNSVSIVHDRDSGQIRIAAGTTLRRRMTDDALQGIQNAVMTPRFASGDPGGAIIDGVRSIVSLDLASASETVRGADEEDGAEDAAPVRLAVTILSGMLAAFIIAALTIRLGRRLFRPSGRPGRPSPEREPERPSRPMDDAAGRRTISAPAPSRRPTPDVGRAAPLPGIGRTRTDGRP